MRLIEREASVVMWHNQRVINTPNHRYNYASDPRAIAVPLVEPLPQADVIFAAMGHVDAIDGEVTSHTPSSSPLERRSKGIARMERRQERRQVDTLDARKRYGRRARRAA